MKEIKAYESNDGRIFKDIEECKHYERNLIEVTKDVFLKIPHQETLADNIYFATNQFANGDRILVMKIRSAYDVEVLNKFFEARGFGREELYSPTDIGTIQLFRILKTDQDMNDIRIIGTPKQYKDAISKEIDKLFSNLIKEN